VNNSIRCYVGLGSNLGDRVENLRRAVALLGEMPGTRVIRTSAVYETAPWGYVDQPAFLNAVAELETTLGAIQLVSVLQSIELALGRTRTFRWGPREIDLDLLLYGESMMARRGLSVPHTSMAERAFVLAPLAELRPDYRAPNGESVARLLERLGRGQDIKRLADSLVVSPVR